MQMPQSDRKNLPKRLLPECHTPRRATGETLRDFAASYGAHARLPEESFRGFAVSNGGEGVGIGPVGA